MSMMLGFYKLPPHHFGAGAVLDRLDVAQEVALSAARCESYVKAKPRPASVPGSPITQEDARRSYAMQIAPPAPTLVSRQTVSRFGVQLALSGAKRAPRRAIADADLRIGFSEFEGGRHDQEMVSNAPKAKTRTIGRLDLLESTSYDFLSFSHDLVASGFFGQHWFKRVSKVQSS